MSKRYAMAVDTRKCVGCHACVLACKAENDLPENGYRDWIVTETSGVFPDLSQEIRSERCNHCDNPPCVDCCPTGASHVSSGGTVLVDQRLRVYPIHFRFRHFLHTGQYHIFAGTF